MIKPRNDIMSEDAILNFGNKEELEVNATHGNTETLRRLLREKDHQLRAIAHDLRNPLGGISSLATLLIEEEGLSEEQSEMIDAIKVAASYTLKLVEGLLNANTPGLSSPYPQEIDVHTVIMNYLRFSEHLMDRKEQTVSVNLMPGQALIIADKEKITRVIDNLIGNAIKFTPQYGEIVINTQIVSDGLQITVKDNGIGIPENIQHQVFSGLGGGRTGTSGEKSHGLGLSICKKIVESYGGTIHFLSRASKGTIFYVWFPNVRLRDGI